jgi:hypothetical protein
MSEGLQVTRCTCEDGRLRGSSRVVAGGPEKCHHKCGSQEAPPTLIRTSEGVAGKVALNR